MARPTVPARPFADWLNKRVCRYETLEEMAQAFGMTERTLYRYRHCLTYDGRPTEVFDREIVDGILRDAGFWLWDVYDDPALYEEPEGRYYPLTKIREDVLEEALRLYEEGRSLWQAMELIYDRTNYETKDSAHRGLRLQFHKRGWMRPLSETMRLVRADAKIQRRCTTILPSGRCQNAAKRDSDLCPSHAALSDEVPAEPFCAWLERRAREFPSQRQFAQHLGMPSSGSIAHWISRSRYGRPITRVRRATVERYAAADGVSFDDIYSERVAA